MSDFHSENDTDSEQNVDIRGHHNGRNKISKNEIFKQKSMSQLENMLVVIPRPVKARL